jgi:hypothetical protein
MSLKAQINSEIEKLNARGGNHGERLEYLDSELNIATGDNEGEAEITLDGIDTIVHVSPHPANHDRFEVAADRDDAEDSTVISCHGFIGAVLFAQGMLQDHKREQSPCYRVMQDEKHVKWFDTVEEARDYIEEKRYRYPSYCTLYCDQHETDGQVTTLFTSAGCRGEEPANIDEASCAPRM